MKSIFNLIALFCVLSLTIISCDKTEEPPPPPHETSDYCNCNNNDYPLTVVISSAPTQAFLRLKEGAYGANNIFFYELDSTEAGFVYKGTNTLIESKIDDKDWVVPTPYLWAAGRAGMDGLDPLVPTIGDEFIYPFLPWTAGSANWESSNGIVNDNVEQKLKKDDQAPALNPDSWYLARMVMGYSINGKFNFTTHCYQKVFKFKRGTY